MSEEEESGGRSGKSIEPKVVVYCGVCGLPPEYCEFGPEFDKCLPWLKQHSPHTYPHLTGADSQAGTAAAAAATATTTAPAAATVKGAESGVKGLSLSEAGATQPPKGGKGKGDGAEEAEVVKLPGGKVKKKEKAKAEIVVEKVTRNKRKSITTIRGMETFGIKLPDAAKKLGKKFACGASVTKGPTEKEQIDVQGDIIFDISDYITETWPDVPEDAIFLVEDGKKTPAY